MLPRDNASIDMRPPGGPAGSLQDVQPTPAVMVSPSELFCHPSRISNTYEPGVERVHQGEIVIPGEDIGVAIRKTVTPAYPELATLGLRGKLATRLEALRRGPRVDLGERLAYDARPVFNGNMAHLVQHHLASLGYLKQRFGYGRDNLAVLLEGKPADLPVQVFARLGYEVVPTNLPVAANLVEISVENFFHLLPYVRHLEIDGWTGGGPQRIFIPRRGSRRLTNEAAVDGCLRAHGFERFYFEDVPIPEQWSLMRHATHIAAIHGAALGCLAFQATRTDRGRAKLIELFGPGFVVNPFRKFMGVLGGKWVGCRGRLTERVVRDIDRPGKAKAHAFDDFELSPETVEAALAFIGTGDQS